KVTDTFITPEPREKERRRVERGEKVEIGDGRDDLIDAATLPRPAYGARPSGPVNGGLPVEDEPPPWPSLEGRGETVIQQGPPPRPVPRRESPGRQVTPRPAQPPPPVSPPVLRPVLGEPPETSSVTDLSGYGGRGSQTNTEEVEDPAVRATVADMPAPAGFGAALAGLGDDALPEPPRAERNPSVTDVEVPQLPPEPITAHNSAGEDLEHTPLDARTTTDHLPAIPLPAPTVSALPVVSLPTPSIPVPLPGASAQSAFTDPVTTKALDPVPLPSTAGPAVPLPGPRPTGAGEPPPVLRAVTLEEPSVSVTPRDGPDDPEASFAATLLRGVADEEEPEIGPDEKTLARDVPGLEEIRRRAAQEEEAEAGQAKTEMRPPQGWSPPPEDAPPPPPPPAPADRGRIPSWAEVQASAAAYSSPGITNPGSTTGDTTMDDEPPAWPSLEGRGETQIGALPAPPPPKKRPGSLRASAPRPAAGHSRPKTGNFVVGQMDDSPLYEPETSAERPRALPPGGGRQEPESVMTDLPAERSDPSLQSYPSSASYSSYRSTGGARGSLVVGPAPLDKRKVMVVAGAAAAALALVVTLAVVLAGGSTEPVWINITPQTAVVRIDGKPVPNANVANVKLGDHELTAAAPGFRPLKRRLTVTKRTAPVVDIMAAADGAAPPETAAAPPPPDPAPAPSRSPAAAATPAPPTTPAAAAVAPAAPKTFVAIFETSELEVEVSIGGKPMGRTPGLTLRGMTVGKDYSFVARKPGFKPVASKFRSDGQATITIPLAMEKLEAPAAAPSTTPGTTAAP
ncbi:MAG TPA: hypothetical protein VFB81_19675, partial [Myxococcales bacterium]|nr:hypothetical protein [Myxococcales bacterium]